MMFACVPRNTHTAIPDQRDGLEFKGIHTSAEHMYLTGVFLYHRESREREASGAKRFGRQGSLYLGLD